MAAWPIILLWINRNLGRIQSILSDLFYAMQIDWLFNFS